MFYDIEHISDIVTKINFTLQKPGKKDFRQCDEKVKIYIDTTLPNIKKVALDPDNVLHTSDEWGFNLLSS